MKPQVIGTACQRIHMALDEALATGRLSLPPELAAHAAQCPHCGPEVATTENLLTRLRDAAAGVGLGRVPQVVDSVLTQIMPETTENVGGTRTDRPGPREAQRRVSTRWVLGQVAAVAAVLAIALGGLSFVILKVNQAVSGASPGDVMARLVAPFRSSDEAQVQKAK